MEPGIFLCLAAVWAAVFGWVGAWVGAARGNWSAGLALGAFLGPVGLIVAGLLPPTAEWEARRALEIEERTRWLEHVKRDHGGDEAAARRAHLERLRLAREVRPVSDDEAFALWRTGEKSEDA